MMDDKTSTIGPAVGVVDAIKRGLADTRASRIISRGAMTAAAQMVLSEHGNGNRNVAPAPIGERPVVWTLTARDASLAILRALAEKDASAAAQVADLLDRAALELATAARGRPGRVAFTFETTRAASPYTLIFEIVTWQKAGNVMAILAVVVDSQASVGPEDLIAW